MSDSDYPWEVIPDPSGGYTIRFPDLPGCMTCVENLYHVNNTAAEIRDLWLATARDAGMAIPETGSYEAKCKRLRELERAVRAIMRKRNGMWLMFPGCLPGQEQGWSYSNDAITAIGRLLEGEE